MLDLQAFSIPLYINYQATFGHQYSFEWHSRFNDISAQNFPLQKAHLFTATSMLGLVLNQGFNHAQRRLAYQASFYFFKTIISIADLYLQNSYLSHRCVGSTICFKPSQLTKTFINLETWGPTSPEILKCYVIKTCYVPEVIGAELKNNRPKRKTLQLESSHCQPTQNL